MYGSSIGRGVSSNLFYHLWVVQSAKVVARLHGDWASTIFCISNLVCG